MQVNDLVKVNDETSEFKGQAGIVQHVFPDGSNKVKLDLETPDNEPPAFTDDQLIFLGR